MQRLIAVREAHRPFGRRAFSGPYPGNRTGFAYVRECKALYEVRYELADRPHWAAIPLEGRLRLLEPPAGTGGGIP